MISVFPLLDPNLFDSEVRSSQPILSPLAQKQIQMAIGEISRYLIVKWCVLTGDALRTDNPRSLLKVIIGVDDKELYPMNIKSMIVAATRVVQRLNNSKSLIIGTQHPVKYILTPRSYSSFKFKDAYALLDDRWLECSYDPGIMIPEKIQVKRPTAKRQYMQSIFRGLNRKDPDYIPDIYKAKDIEVSHGRLPLDAAKRNKTGIWRISRYQALDIAKKYHLTHLPKRRKPYKMLGNTGVMMFRPKKNTFFLIKGSYVKKIKKAFSHVVYA